MSKKILVIKTYQTKKLKFWYIQFNKIHIILKLTGFQDEIYSQIILIKFC